EDRPPVREAHAGVGGALVADVGVRRSALGGVGYPVDTGGEGYQRYECYRVYHAHLALRGGDGFLLHERNGAWFDDGEGQFSEPDPGEEGEGDGGVYQEA